MRPWCKGSTPVFKTGMMVSKTIGVGSSPTGRAKKGSNEPFFSLCGKLLDIASKI